MLFSLHSLKTCISANVFLKQIDLNILVMLFEILLEQFCSKLYQCPTVGCSTCGILSNQILCALKIKLPLLIWARISLVTLLVMLPCTLRIWLGTKAMFLSYKISCSKISCISYYGGGEGGGKCLENNKINYVTAKYRFWVNFWNRGWGSKIYLNVRGGGCIVTPIFYFIFILPTLGTPDLCTYKKVVDKSISCYLPSLHHCWQCC